MKISTMLNELAYLLKTRGDIEVTCQDGMDPSDEMPVQDLFFRPKDDTSYMADRIYISS